MSVTSNIFILFLLAALSAYYLVPRKWQWKVLLAFSYIYYGIADLHALLWLISATLVSYIAALAMKKQNREESVNKAAEEPGRQERRVIRRKCWLLVGLLSEFGLLAVLKYTDSFILNFNLLFHAKVSLVHLLAPLGISYYVFMTAGYLLDVYWERILPEQNLARYALFVSFFPHMVQGPISRYGTLSEQLFTPHTPEPSSFAYGMERIIWGLFKKMVLADWAAVYVEAIFAQPDMYAGLIWPGLLLYTIQLYGDFAGGIDVMIGVAALYGIRMDENFRQPYFAVSLADFWRRWHITLGTWMKDYVMYPLTLSAAMAKVGKKSRKLFGRKRGRLVPICLSNIIVFLLVGLWHGGTWQYILWGFYNGLIIAFSIFFAAEFETLKKGMKVNDQSRGYHVFMVLRTFFITMIGNYVDLAKTPGELGRMLQYMVTRFSPKQILEISSGKLGTAFTPYALLILLFGSILLFLHSFIRENDLWRGREEGRLMQVGKVVFLLLLLVSIPFFAPMSMARGFIYAQF